MLKNEALAKATLLVQIFEDNWGEQECVAVTLLLAGEEKLDATVIKEKVKQVELENVTEISRKEMIKLHHYFGHCHPKKLKELILRAGRWGAKSRAGSFLTRK